MAARVVSAASGSTGAASGAAAGGGSESLSTVRNAARLLKEFRSRESYLGVSELARRLGLGKSTVHRLLTTLATEGLIEQDPRTGGYRLGIVVFELGEAVKVHLDLHTAGGPVLASLREETGESSQIGVLDGFDVVYVDRMESQRTIRMFTETGRRMPVHCTSSGKVLLAHLDPCRLDDLLAASALERLTLHTITDPDLLRLELRRVRERGWSDAVEERELGVASIAAPIRRLDGTVIAAISVGAPVSRLGALQRRRYGPVVAEAAKAVSRRLGWVPDSDRTRRHG